MSEEQPNVWPWPEDTRTNTASTAPVQPRPEITIEPMPTNRWLRLTHPGIVKHFTLAEGEEIHRYMGDTCASDCDCYRRGLEDGQREGAAQGNMGARA